jgi:recombination protein RecA
VKVAKNKVAPPFKLAEFDIMYGQGISREGSLLDVGVDLDIVKKSGAWFTYEGEQLGQGRENAKQFLHDNVDMMLEIMEKIRVAAGINDIDLTEDGEELGDVAEAAAAVIAEAEAVEKSNGAKASSKK